MTSRLRALGGGLVEIAGSADAMPTIVCFPFAGGSAQSFAPWAGTADGCHLVVAELAGRGRRWSETPSTSIEAAAAAFAAAIAAARLNAVVLFGHSLGALVAFETARRLGAHDPSRALGLVVASRGAPASAAGTNRLPDDSLAGVRAYLADLGGTPSSLLANDDFMAAMLPILRADFDLLRTYRRARKPPMDVPIHVIGTTSDELVGFQSLLGWKEETSDGFSLEMRAGGHFAPLADSRPVIRKAREFAASGERRTTLMARHCI